MALQCATDNRGFRSPYGAAGSLAYGADLTYTVWFYRGQNIAQFIKLGSINDYYNGAITFRCNDSNYMALGTMDGKSFATTKTVARYTWTFLAWVYNHSAKYWYLYHGTEAATVTLAHSADFNAYSSAWYPSSGASNWHAQIGNGSGGVALYAGDRIAYPKLYTSALSLSDLETAQSQATPVSGKTVYGDWRLGGYSSTHLNDESGNSRTLTYDPGVVGDWSDVSNPTLPAGSSGVAKQASYYAMLRSA